MSLSECGKCGRCNTRTQVVLGSGILDTDVMFIGEAPGRDEDKKGKPFVGPAGRVLSAALKYVKLSRDEIYLTNVVKCARRDGGHNVAPVQDEIKACKTWMNVEFKKVSPKLVVLLGGVALKAVLGLDGVMKKRGRVFDRESDGVERYYFVVPHPVTLVRDDSEVNLARYKEDLKVLRLVLEKLHLGRVYG